MKIPVRIADIREISPTVKSFTLALDGQPFTFLPGQWIDCFIDIGGRTEVAGYSMTSSPTEDGWFSIAVEARRRQPRDRLLTRLRQGR